MSTFDNLRTKLLANFSDWIQVTDYESNWTIENVPVIQDKGVDENAIKPHCIGCVIANQCWFKDEKNKKPDKSYFEAFMDKSFIYLPLPGLYHPHCHCEETKILAPTTQTVKVVVEDGKIVDFFDRKIGLAQSWGYRDGDKELFKAKFLELVYDAYLKGEYQIFKFDAFGIQISIYISIPGVNEKKGRRYNRETGFMIYPNGKLKNTTIVGRKW